ncbi:hypothetical protein ANN_05026 [Periplaneta americana]|uniref:Uncharacterized protein n=1 Tax=Periplaneta americana TaxID=6978 RepID=A0ABQ8TBQ2_PERAM|nr:hypothetical protein ANN_05026 [Periplaneta americana]
MAGLCEGGNEPADSFKAIIGLIPFEKNSQIAEYLGLKNAKDNTGHCLRRLSTILLAGSGANILILKRHGGCKSTTVTEGYGENSIESKKRVTSLILKGCETWTLTLREEQRLRVFENKVLREIFRAKRDEVTEEWRKLRNAELHALYSSPNIIRNIKSRRLRWGGHVARMGESRNAYRVLVGRPEGERPLGRPRRRWEDNINMDLREVGYDDRDWINLVQNRDRWRAYVRATMNLRVP